MNTAALASLRGAQVDAEELLAKRRVELQAVQAERAALEREMAKRDKAQARDRERHLVLVEREGRLVGQIETRRLNGAGR